ncbi:hypothetical protein TRVL_01113 [Trypanosoma vivax]|uniref:Uncharacterized protein n=1 Tax=Trypanosoma vivax (strain Y486) TaxID=1055687 RepID=G0U707_TRYVY|nr:hypothetical protein TRVL_01113 [Trypanosoma vivax]CCC51664.1 conserved hypothetical protein [Trypanosoma vivax Y486]
MFFVAPYAALPRQTVEMVFGGLYKLNILVHGISFIVLMTQYTLRLESSLNGYLSSRTPSLSESLRVVMHDCEYIGTLSIAGAQLTVGVNGNSLTAALVSMTQHVIAILTIQFLALANNLVWDRLYSSGIRNTYVFGTRMPISHIISTLSFVYCITLIVLVCMAKPLQDYYSRGVSTCAAQLSEQDPEAFSKSGFDDVHMFGVPLEIALTAAAVNLVIYVISAIARICKSRDKGAMLLTMADTPWELPGLRFAVDKAALTIHTAARESILAEARAAIERGEEVRIVRGYTLMTEEDYQEQLEQMREEFASRTRKEQLENMHAQFERSEIDDTGLLWDQDGAYKHHSFAAPQTAGQGAYNAFAGGRSDVGANGLEGFREGALPDASGKNNTGALPVVGDGANGFLQGTQQRLGRKRRRHRDKNKRGSDEVIGGNAELDVPDPLPNEGEVTEIDDGYVNGGAAMAYHNHYTIPTESCADGDVAIELQPDRLDGEVVWDQNPDGTQEAFSQIERADRL